MSGTAIFRADAGPLEGSGHVSRCLTLAQALAERGWRVILATRAGVGDFVPGIETSGVEIVEMSAADLAGAAAVGRTLDLSADIAILDGYDFSAKDENDARKWARLVMALDDQPNRMHDCDILLDQTSGRRASAYKDCVAPGTEILAGADFILLNKAFLKPDHAGRQLQRDRKDVSVVLSFGASDEHDLAGRTLRELALAGWTASVTVVLPRAAPFFADVSALIAGLPFSVELVAGATADEMAEILSGCDVAAGAGGVSTWERCVIGVPSVIVTVADNQAGIARATGEAGAALPLGDVADLKPGAIAAAIIELADDPQRRMNMSDATRKICDGRGSERVARAIIARAKGSQP